MNFLDVFFFEYSIILVFLGICVVLAIVLFLVSYLLASQIGGLEKLSIYECGFEPFEDARNIFDVKFYIVALLFIIFDLEVTFIYPWTLVLNFIGSVGFWSMFLFLMILTIGFIYEWKRGGLDY
jgi:NADH:ubiquinone oxidoreductase subunit 3 (subunit A)